MTKKRYVVDTNALISYHSDVFCKARKFVRSPKLSKTALGLISDALATSEGRVLLSIPSIVFIEIYSKWLDCEEFANRFFYEVFVPIKQSPNIEVRGIDEEILQNLLQVGGCLLDHDLHDKLVVASALTLECPIISTDQVIRDYIRMERVPIPEVLA